MLIIELILEGLPQVIQLLGFSVNEYFNSHGRLVQIYGDTMKNYLGLNGTFLVIVLMCLQTAKFTLTSLRIAGERTSPLGFGFVGSILVLGANGFFVVAKMAVMTIGFLTMPYLYYAVTMMEFIVILGYKKMIGGDYQITNEVLGSVLTPAHFYVKDSKCHYYRLQRWDGMLHKIILHVLMMVLVYIPARVALEYTPIYENYTNILGHDFEIVVMGIYFFAIVPFVAFNLIRFYFFNPWNLLKKNEKTEIIDMGNETLTANQQTRFVDPFNLPGPSFMGENLQEAKIKLIKNKV